MTVTKTRIDHANSLNIEAQKLHKIHRFNSILDQAKDVRAIVVIDWFSVNFYVTPGIIKEPENPDESFAFQVNESLALIYKGSGNKHYKYRWDIVYIAETVGTLLSHTRNQKFVKTGTIKIDFKNHLFYSKELWNVYDFLINSMGLNFKSVSRLDIAFDGLNYLMDFCNLYVMQEKNKVVDFTGRARINSKVFDRTRMQYESFGLGAGNSSKVITIYNKSLDIVNTRKEYIQRFWQINGIMNKLLPIDQLNNIPNKVKSERIYLEGYENIYRFELRLKSDALQQIKDFKVQRLKDSNYLVSIVKLHTRAFFEAIFTTNTRNTRSKKIELLPFSKFDIIPLEKVELKERTDIYKAKLNLNKTVKWYFTGRYEPENASVYETFMMDIRVFSLETWFKNKYRNEWEKNYSVLNSDAEYVSKVKSFFESLFDQFSTNTN